MFHVTTRLRAAVKLFWSGLLTMELSVLGALNPAADVGQAFL
jgi:hypothetical protein